MFKKQDPWESGIRLVSRLLGFEDSDYEVKYAKQPHGGNGLYQPQSVNQIPLSSRGQRKSIILREKWKKLMNNPAEKCSKQIIQLLRNQGSAIEDEVWMWLLKNTQKITPQLYALKREKLHAIMYNRNIFKWNEQFNDPNVQIQDFTQYPEFRQSQMEIKHEQNKRQKVSITKSNQLKVPSGQTTGRMSLNSQASTFSSQTHISQDFPFLNNEQVQWNKGSNRKFDLQTSSSHESSSNRSVYANTCANSPQCAVSPIQNESLDGYVFLQKLPSIVNHKPLTDVIGSFLLQRQDISYSVTLFNIAATFYFYTGSSQSKTFILLNNFVSTEVYLPYLSKNSLAIEGILQHIADKIRKTCPSSVFLKRFRLQNFIESWIFSMFFSICENGSELKQKAFGFLLLEKFSLDAITKFCTSLISSMARILNQGIDQKAYQCLQNPKLYVDKQIFLGHLLTYEEKK